MKTLLFFFLFAPFAGCNNSTGTAHITQRDSIGNIIDSIDYCTACDSLEMWQGGIQGVEVSDSTKMYLFAECHTNKVYDLLYVPQGDIVKFTSSISSDSLSTYYDNAKEVNYKNLDCYSFVIRKTKHKEAVNQEDCDCEDLESYDYVFPDTVKVLKRTGGGWQLIKTKKVTSFEQLGRLKLNTIFHID